MQQSVPHPQPQKVAYHKPAHRQALQLPTHLLVGHMVLHPAVSVQPGPRSWIPGRVR